ncbi:MAG TPA: type II secretion system F family protein [Steroidobacteraceae bacterium]|nr:type II secretion system F family protein [Steroidobacteraceae bacterium]
MDDTSPLWLAMLAVGACAVGVPGLGGLFDIRAALRLGELERLSSPRHWRATRAFIGALAALPVYVATASLGAGALGAALVAALLGYAVSPALLREARQRAEQALLDELTLHLDLMALVLESGGSLRSAITICAERAPDGPLRRAWAAAMLEMHAGAEVMEVLRVMEQRVGLRALTVLVTALRATERNGLDPVVVMRERARQAAASRFARAERLARVAPLKLWATMLLCIAPCTLLVLAFPVARVLALVIDR